MGGEVEILTEACLDALTHEAGEMAAVQGRVTMTELGTKFNLPVDVSTVHSSRLTVDACLAVEWGTTSRMAGSFICSTSR